MVQLHERRGSRGLLLVSAMMLSCLATATAWERDLEARTVLAYEQYIAKLDQQYARGEGAGPFSLATLSPSMRAQLRRGEILASAGGGDGILDVPKGLIHHWQAAAFIPNVSMQKVLAVAQDYDAYADSYEAIIRSKLLDRVPLSNTRGERFRAVLRLKRSAGVVTSTLDLWSTIDYHYLQPGLAIAMSDSDCIRQVDNAGKPDERLLPVGEGSGYLWRANTYSTYQEGDGGVYVEMHSLGLSRGFPPLLGWMIEPIARRLGRGSGMEGLKELRQAIAGTPAPAKRDAPPSWPQPGWCK